LQNSTEIYIIDANVIFDADIGGILHELFSLDLPIITNDFVIGEIESIPISRLEEMGLDIRDMPGEYIEEMFQMRANHLDLSIIDISIIVLARHTNAIILSGDGPLRKEAKRYKLQLHGTLWVLDVLVEHHILSPKDAAGALRAMCDNERRLPMDECNKRIQEWESKD